MSPGEVEDNADILDDIVVNKYKMAAEVTNGVLSELILLCVDGANVLELCLFGDKRINERVGCLFKKDKKVNKGVSFPTSISINNVICNCSPFEDDTLIMKNGDVIKINLGSYVDGYAAVVGHTFVVGSSREVKVTGKRADVILAANNAADAVLRLLRPGNQNVKVVDLVSKVAAEFNCHSVEGIRSHQMKQMIFEAEKNIISSNSEVQPKSFEKCNFEENDVWDIDVVVSSGSGKARQCDVRTTIYKKIKSFNPKLRASRVLIHELENKFNEYPFNMRSLSDPIMAKLGVPDLVKHEVLQPFDVYTEKDGEFVAQFRYTVLMMPNGPMKITGVPVDVSLYKSQFKIKDVGLKELISLPVKIQMKKKKTLKAGETDGSV